MGDIKGNTYSINHVICETRPQYCMSVHYAHNEYALFPIKHADSTMHLLPNATLILEWICFVGMDLHPLV